MFRMSEAVQIDRAPADVFGFMADLDNFPLWRANLASSTVMSEQSNLVGAWCEEEIQVGRRRIPGTCSITAMSPGREFTFRAGSPGLTYDGRLLVEPDGSGSRLTLGGEVRISGLLRVLEPALRHRMRAGLRSEVATVKRVLESERPAGGSAG